MSLGSSLFPMKHVAQLEVSDCLSIGYLVETPINTHGSCSDALRAVM